MKHNNFDTIIYSFIHFSQSLFTFHTCSLLLTPAQGHRETEVTPSMQKVQCCHSSHMWILVIYLSLLKFGKTVPSPLCRLTGQKIWVVRRSDRLQKKIEMKRSSWGHNRWLESTACYQTTWYQPDYSQIRWALATTPNLFDVSSRDCDCLCTFMFKEVSP